jgi:hypothetical protein
VFPVRVVDGWIEVQPVAGPVAGVAGEES